MATKARSDLALPVPGPSRAVAGPPPSGAWASGPGTRAGATRSSWPPASSARWRRSRTAVGRTASAPAAADPRALLTCRLVPRSLTATPLRRLSRRPSPTNSEFGFPLGGLVADAATAALAGDLGGTETRTEALFGHAKSQPSSIRSAPKGPESQHCGPSLAWNLCKRPQSPYQQAPERPASAGSGGRNRRKCPLHPLRPCTAVVGHEATVNPMVPEHAGKSQRRRPLVMPFAVAATIPAAAAFIIVLPPVKLALLVFAGLGVFVVHKAGPAKHLAIRILGQSGELEFYPPQGSPPQLDPQRAKPAPERPAIGGPSQ